MSTEERVSVKTSIPRYQKQAWTDHADALDMSQSEFVRTMVQAGRNGFELDPLEPASTDVNPGGSGFEDAVLEALSAEAPREFDEIVDAVSDRLDDLVEDTLESLTDAGVIEVSPRGGIKLVEGRNGGD